MVNHITTPPPSDYVWADRISPLGDLIHRPGPLYAQGLLDTAKYRPTWILGSVSPKHRP
jgi:hypothetical protein